MDISKTVGYGLLAVGYIAKNSKDGFVKAFTFFTGNPDQIIEMGKRSYELAENEYSLTQRNQQLRRIYQDILIDQP